MNLAEALRLHTKIADVETDIRRLTMIQSKYESEPLVQSKINQVIGDLEYLVRDLEKHLSKAIEQNGLD